jgi:hypothetical protein
MGSGKERIWRTACGIRSLGSFLGNMLTSAFGSEHRGFPHATIGYEADLTDENNASLRLRYQANGVPVDDIGFFPCGTWRGMQGGVFIRPDTSGRVGSWDRRGHVLRASCDRVHRIAGEIGLKSLQPDTPKAEAVPRAAAPGYYDCMSAFTTKRGGAPITKEEARAAVETELFALKLTRPMTPAEKDAFCEIANSLNYQSNSYRIREIHSWVESWQSLWLPEKLGSR